MKICRAECHNCYLWYSSLQASIYDYHKKYQFHKTCDLTDAVTLSADAMHPSRLEWVNPSPHAKSPGPISTDPGLPT